MDTKSEKQTAIAPMKTAGRQWVPFWRLKAQGEYSASTGYTLIELVVVIAVISVMFFLAVPRIGGSLLVDQKRKVCQWFMTTVPSLKNRALSEQKDYLLHVDTVEQRLWITHAEMSASALNAALEAQYRLPEQIRIREVAFPAQVEPGSGQSEIVFHADGYSDKALIHMQDAKGRPFTFLIETFLPHVTIFEGDVDFEN